MKNILIATLLFLSIPAYSQITKGVYHISTNNDCLVDKGEFTVLEIRGDSAKFVLSVSNKLGFTGYMDGQMKQVRPGSFVFHGEDSSTLYVKMIGKKTIKIAGKHCDTYHGGFICFNGIYIR